LLAQVVALGTDLVTAFDLSDTGKQQSDAGMSVARQKSVSVFFLVVRYPPIEVAGQNTITATLARQGGHTHCVHSARGELCKLQPVRYCSAFAEIQSFLA
jgi:hypothetical protein